MRVVTLLPAATEIVATLGGSEQLVGISHECDFPPEITGLPRVTVTPVDSSAPGAVIDAEVRRLRTAGRPVIAVDAAQLRRLAADLVITQGLCEVCAVADGEVHRLAASLPRAPEVLSLSASTVGGILDDIRQVARALDLEGEADELIAGLRYRLTRLGSRRGERRTRTVCIEWLEPLYLAGHWVPEMVEAAGGEDVGAAPGSHSARREWSELADLSPELILVALCGFDVSRAERELSSLSEPAARRVLSAAPVWILDGNTYTSRPGPRIVVGVERLHAMLQGHEVDGLKRWRALWSND